ncbi:MAG TPA: YARHG domain-containing protein [Clostridium sp.]|nr:YARHG domain-containing protein [Clostridium sp.]
MLKFKKLIIFILVFFIWCTNQICYTSSSSEGMMGNTIYPINSNNVRIESQIININYNTLKENNQNFHQIEVIFNLHNTGEATQLEIGFPNTISSGENLKDFKVLSYPDLTPLDITLNFKEAILLLSEIEDYHHSSYYSWTVDFEENERKSILIKYKLENTDEIIYILKTGSLWKGRINEIDVNVEFSEPVSSLEIDANPENYYYNGKGIQWQFKNIEPTFDLYIKHIPVPEFYQLKNKFYTPYQKEPDGYKWDNSLFYIGTMLEEFDGYLFECTDQELVLEEIKKRLDTCELVRNEIYARKGYIFSESKWDDFFTQQSWYEPDIFFEYAKLNEIEKTNIRQILEFESAMKDLEDKTFDEIIKNLKEYSLKYDDKQKISYTNSSFSKINRTYLEITTQQKRIEQNRKSFKELIVVPEKFTEFKTNYNSDNLPSTDIKDIDMTNMHTYINGIIKITDNNSDTLFIDKNDSICRLTNLESMKVKSISPNGKYVIMSGNNSIPGFVSDDIYLISTSNGVAYLIGKGDYNDHQFIWSYNDSLQYRSLKKDTNIINHFNSQDGTFSTIVVPISDFEIFYLSEDNSAAVLQSGNIIYYMNSQDQSIKKIIEDGNLMGFCSSNNKILFHKGCEIYEYDLSYNSMTKKVSADKSIWKTLLIHNNMYIIYSGSDLIYCYNYNTDSLNKFYNMDNGKDIKVSPEGDKLLFHRFNELNSYIVYKDNHLKVPLNVMSTNSVWIDNDNFVNYSYDQDTKDIIKTNTCVTENSTEYYSTYSKSINNKSNPISNNLFIYVCFVLLIILGIIYWLYKKKMKISK